VQFQSLSKGKKMSVIKLVAIALISFAVQGCVLTKVVSVPMRLGGAVVSVVPTVGNTAHEAIDKAANVVDDVPL
jgi:hypothetical protein